MDDAQLRTVWQQRQLPERAVPLGHSVALLIKHDLAKKVRQLGRLATIWDELLPEELREHTALESFSRGLLTVLVDSSPHRYQLQMLLNGGLMHELRARFSGALNKVKLNLSAFNSIESPRRPALEA